MNIKLKPFPVPTEAIFDMPPMPKQQGMIMLPKILLSEIPQSDLKELCNEWRASVFKLAEKIDPDVEQKKVYGRGPIT